MTLMQTAIILKDLSSALASQGILGTELSAQVGKDLDRLNIKALSISFCHEFTRLSQ